MSADFFFPQKRAWGGKQPGKRSPFLFFSFLSGKKSPLTRLLKLSGASLLETALCGRLSRAPQSHEQQKPGLPACLILPGAHAATVTGNAEREHPPPLPSPALVFFQELCVKNRGSEGEEQKHRKGVAGGARASERALLRQVGAQCWGGGGGKRFQSLNFPACTLPRREGVYLEEGEGESKMHGLGEGEAK